MLFLSGVAALATRSKAVVFGSCGPNGLGLIVMFGIALLPFGCGLICSSAFIALLQKRKSDENGHQLGTLGL